MPFVAPSSFVVAAVTLFKGFMALEALTISSMVDLATAASALL
jgi:hypothetical protein